MQRAIYVCDECGAEQQQANHWWTLAVTYRSGGRGNTLALARLGTVAGDETWDLCGMACMLRKVDEFARREIQEAQPV